jgi:hypothetical protein
MSPLRAESPAFRLALLKSERLRIHILLAAVGVALLIRLIRTLVAWNSENTSALLWVVLCSAVLLIFGNERLEHSVRGARDKSAAEIISILYKDVIQFAGGTSQKDDLTEIVIKRI